jgi:D-alanine-D-alanine ligase
MEHVMHRLGERVVVKPTRGGSALGISGVDGLAALPSALVETYAYCEDALIERFHDGVDVSVVVLESDEGLRSLTPVAIEYEKGHEFDFSARYTAEFVGLTRPDLPEDQLQRLGEVARDAHRTLGLRDLSRSDFIVGADGSFVLLETAITPGTTETSVFPYACTASGTTLGEVARDLLVRAVRAG